MFKPIQYDNLKCKTRYNEDVFAFWNISDSSTYGYLNFWKNVSV